MQITLRKAGQLVSALERQLEALAVSGSAEVSIYDPAALESLQAARVAAGNSLAGAAAVEDAILALRVAVDRANGEAGVRDLMAREALLKRRVTRLERVAALRPAPSTATTEGRLAALKVQPADRYGIRSETVVVEILGAEEIAAAASELRVARSALVETRDEIMALNLTTRIDLPEAVALVVEKYALT